MLTLSRLTFATAFLAAGTLPVSAELRYNNEHGGSALFYGQVNLGVLSYDDGMNKKTRVIDNQNSNTRVGLLYEQPYGDNTFKFHFESSLGLLPSSGVTQGRTPNLIHWDRSRIRRIDFSWDTAKYGTFAFGQGSMSTDGAAENDMSGTDVAAYVSIGDVAGGFRFRDVSGALTSTSVGDLYSDLDGGRRLRFRYDTPEYSGFSLSAAYGKEVMSFTNHDRHADVALRYSKDFGRFKMKAAVGYSNQHRKTGSNYNNVIGSFSVLHDTGLNFTTAVGDRDNGGQYNYHKIGYIADWFSVGKTAFSADYYHGKDFDTNGSKSNSFGLAAVQNFDKNNLAVYLAYRHYNASEPGQDYYNSSSVLFGARYKF